MTTKTTKSQALQVFAAVSMSVASAFAGSRVQHRLDRAEIESAESALEWARTEYLKGRCPNEKP